MRNEFEVLHHECNATFSINGRTENKLNCTLKHFHMHFKSEHTIDGKHKDGELHLVHGCDDNTVVVIGMLMEKAKKENIGEVNFFGTEYLNKSLEYGGNFTGDYPNTSLPFDSLLVDGPFAGTYFNYMGSLTTPPCTESVTWIVMEKTLKVNATMFDQLADRLGEAPSRARFENLTTPESNRNIQELGDRTINKGKLLLDKIFPAHESEH
jgi:carbonic anhydrase